MKIEIYTKNVYGNEVTYIRDTDIAKNIQSLTGRKTLTNNDKRALIELGFAFITVNN